MDISDYEAIKRLIDDLEALKPAFGMLGWTRNELNQVQNTLSQVLEMAPKPRRRKKRKKKRES